LFGGLHGTHVTQGLRGLVFSSTTNIGPNQFLDVTSGAGNSPPLALYNPPTSRRFVSVIRWELAITTAPITPVIGAFVFLTFSSAALSAPTTSNTVLSVISKFRSFSAIANTGAIPGVGTFYRPFANHLTGASTTLPNSTSLFTEFDGTCILPPNTWIWVAQVNSDVSNSVPESKVIWEEFSPP
jgi:hypothetical protein